MIENLLVCDRSAAMFLAAHLGKGAGYWSERMRKDISRRRHNQEFAMMEFLTEFRWRRYYKLSDLLEFVDSVESIFSKAQYLRMRGAFRKATCVSKVFVGATYSDRGQLSILSNLYVHGRSVSPDCALQYSKDFAAAVKLCSRYEFDFPNWDIVTKREMRSRSNLIKLLANKRLAIQTSESCHG